MKKRKTDSELLLEAEERMNNFETSRDTQQKEDINYRELLERYLHGLGSKKIDFVAGLFLVAFADWLQINATQPNVKRVGWRCAPPCRHWHSSHVKACVMCGSPRPEYLNEC